MKTRDEKILEQIVEHQIRLQEKIQSAGFNIVECGNKMDLSDCPDLFHSRMENNEEFNN